MRQGFIYIVLILFPIVLFAQQDSIQKIGEVKIYSNFAKKDQIGVSILYFSDSILQTNTTNFTELLQEKANLYIKQYGRAMVASVSLRGTGSSHTAVYWNGIAINSFLNGQTDFNTLNPSLFQKISLRKGGGSVLLGSGAIAGAVNLENNLTFSGKTKGNISLGIASYQTYITNLMASHSNKNWVFQVGVSGMQSANDYPYIGTDKKNENGAFQNKAIQVGIGYKFTNKNKLFYKNLISDSDRNTSGSLSATSHANLRYIRNNHLLEWVSVSNKHQSITKFAYTEETYRYLFDIAQPEAKTTNKSHQWTANYTLAFQNHKFFDWVSGIDLKHIEGNGDNIGLHFEKNAAVFAGINYNFSTKFTTNFSVRKAWSDTYKIPLLASFSGRMKWNKHLVSTYSLSNNFRSPTLNDLFWQPGGNLDLKPENTWNTELSTQWKNRQLSINTTLYYIKASNLIQWKPSADVFVWQPINIQSVNSYGLEYNTKCYFKINGYPLSVNLQYAFTVSVDQETQKQLTYVPYHLGSINLDYTYKSWNFNFNQRYNGSVFTTSSNTEQISDFWISSLYVSKKILKNQFDIALKINNLFNTTYQIISDRPMPNINYKLIVQFKF